MKKLLTYSENKGSLAREQEDFNFKNIDLSNQKFEDMYFCKLDFFGANFSKAVFKNCNFANSILVNANLQGASFEKCEFKGCNMTSAKITQSTIFYDCKNLKETIHKQKHDKNGKNL